MAGDGVQKKPKKTKKAESGMPPGPKVRYKYCVVPQCRSTTSSAPHKLFFSIPTGEPRRRWCEVMGRREPAHRPLSPACNRFCCQDHFDLEKDMENYIPWKLMGKKYTKKLILKKGVLPHKFDCQGVQSNDTTIDKSEEETRKELIDEILEEAREKEAKVNVEQKPKTEIIYKPKTMKRHLAETISLQQNVQVKKNIKEDEILEQKRKLEKISNDTSQAELTSQAQATEIYTFDIKVEPEDDLESNHDDSLLNQILQDCNTVAQSNNQILDVDIKVEQLDEEFEPEIVEKEIDEAITTIKTDITETLSLNGTHNIETQSKNNLKPLS